jgi:hypothetical protein
MAIRSFKDSQQPVDESGAAAHADASKLLRKLGEGSAAAAGVYKSQAITNNAKHWRYENVTPPAAADWRTAQPPILGPIKDQHVGGAPCGSCWVGGVVFRVYAI